MIDTQFMLDKLKQLVSSIDEPCCIVMNIGEASMFVQNNHMVNAQRDYKSVVYHSMNICCCYNLANVEK
jgi:hypothetical protein